MFFEEDRQERDNSSELDLTEYTISLLTLIMTPCADPKRYEEAETLTNNYSQEELEAVELLFTTASDLSPADLMALSQTLVCLEGTDPSSPEGEELNRQMIENSRESLLNLVSAGVDVQRLMLHHEKLSEIQPPNFDSLRLIEAIWIDLPLRTRLRIAYDLRNLANKRYQAALKSVESEV